MKFKKLISKSLAVGFFLNSSIISFAGILSDDGRYETFEGDYITIDNVLEDGNIELDEIQGNTMVNYVQDGDKELILNGYIDLEGTSVTTTEGVDAGLVDIEIEGNTLVNLFSKNRFYGLQSSDSHQNNTEFVSNYSYDATTRTVKGTFLKTTNEMGCRWSYFALGSSTLNMIKPNTTYTIFVNDTSNILNEITFMDGNATNSITESFSKVKQGVFKLTTKSSFNDVTVKHQILYGGYNWYYKGDFDISVIGVLEGDHSDKDISYFEGIKSVGQDDENGHKIEIASKNSNNTLSNKKEIILNEPLRGLPNGVKDRVVKKDGKWYIERNCSEVLYDGDENWRTNSFTQNRNNTIARYIHLPSAKSNTYLHSNNFTIFYNINNDVEGVQYDGWGLYISIDKLKVSSDDTKGFKEWLSNNPTTIIYERDTPIYEPLEIEPILNTYTGITNISNNSTIPANMKVKNTGYDCILKPNTKYTIAVDTDKYRTIEMDLGGAKGETSNNVLTLTTPETLVDSSLRVYGKGIKISDIRVLEGDVSDSIPAYFEGMQSSFEDDIQDNGSYNMKIISNNKNIVDINEVEGYDDSYGTLSKDANNVITYTGKSSSSKESVSNCKKTNLKVFLEKGQTYTFGFKTDGVLGSTQGTDTVEMFWLRNGNAEDSFFNVSTNSKTVTINRTGWYYARFDVNKGDSTHRFWDIFATKDSLDNEYIPHQSNKIQISLSEPLRAVGDAKDRIIKRNGQWVVERNFGEIIFNGSNDENWFIPEAQTEGNSILFRCKDKTDNKRVDGLSYPNLIADKLTTLTPREAFGWDGNGNLEGVSTGTENLDGFDIRITKSKLKNVDIDSFKQWLSENPVKVVYQLENPTYEPLNIDLNLYTYSDITHISNNSNIPTNMKITYDRTINKAVEAIELAKINPTISNISKARMWSNLLKESINKDSLQNEISSITNIEDLQLERKTTTANVDVYIKSENMLLMSLSTNHITFNDYSGVEDIELNNAINISINSSLPYQLNSYLVSEIQNSDGSQSIDKSLFNIKDNIDNTYKQFNNINEKLVLKDDCESGNNKIHNIDLMLEGRDAHVADIYKTTIKFEAEQK